MTLQEKYDLLHEAATGAMEALRDCLARLEVHEALLAGESEHYHNTLEILRQEVGRDCE